MAQEKEDNQNSIGGGQSGQVRENDNPQLLNSEMAKAFQELAHGERTASALEAKLDGIESRIEELLASVETGSRQPRHASESAAHK
ncbi:hypothetical protein PV08_04656 [Exophiala spinifera]|uniref:Uncharacterized protein n=1 Tax=Exophiala spinifera TaxID=91928 RepID=A0A0D1ZXV6_9EURO|nr:uncharacterized protein PV08_04656 [Exophiala spinifera]KIW17462.1 hypothetical protein PV08_04656 [Exophiala spinifera]